MRRGALLGIAAVSASILAQPARAQELPLAPVRGAAQGVWPAFEGWYDNHDGTYVLYFGYMNRNTEEIVEIPLGERNFIEPAEFDGKQPTRFEPRRHWGVFGIVVPADFGADKKVYWNLVVNGKTNRIPGHLRPEWKTDAIGGGAMGDTPPVLRFGSAEGHGPLGVTASQTLRTSVGRPVELRVAASDKAGNGPDLAALAGGGRGRGRVPQVTLTWFKHQGPGHVEFSSPTDSVPSTGGEMTTMATFDTPGEYVVRVRANDSAMASAGDAQCCWSNGFVRVTVTP